ncbi:hypothetical protein BDA96_01G329200 [Sorghum bicolor]|uniref:Uncharacterized protein n=1 Tax=Sorghum bicolor TaxID=4558 RepID=A0A921V0N4_SORBI|nr:hypothetical protein BDA96_01G329200 [Sorghum bicolor]
MCSSVSVACSLFIPLFYFTYWHYYATPQTQRHRAVRICCLIDGVVLRKGPSGFSGASTAEEVTAGIDGHGLVAVITGASSGIGLETARVLALRGVHVVMAVRNVSAGLEAREAIVAKIPGARIDVLELDLSSIASQQRWSDDKELHTFLRRSGTAFRDKSHWPFSSNKPVIGEHEEDM